jgi:two-component system sensor histidine kinase KdpD
MPDSQPPSDTGILKVFLGFASGVGKTYAMLDEAHRRKSRGQDVVVGVVDAHGRRPILDLLEDLEQIPTKYLTSFRSAELDVDAVLARNPGVVIADDIAHTLTEGGLVHRRVDDIRALLDRGISVLTTLNVGQLESLQDVVRDITGITEGETVSDEVLHQADEVELVDVTPRALINRFERGDVVPVEAMDSMRQAFSEGSLLALRELALREAVGRVDEDVLEYRKDKRIERPWATTDRVLICLSPTRSSLRQIRRGWRIGQRLHGEVIAAYVDEGPLNDQQKRILQDDFALAEKLGIQTHRLKGDAVAELVKFAKEKNVSQIILGHSSRSRLQEAIKGSVASDLARSLPTVDILLIAHNAPPAGSHG